MLSFTVDDKAVQYLEVLGNKSSLPVKLMEGIGNIMFLSVRDNFDSQGRPTNWVKRKIERSWPILNKTGTLKNSGILKDITTNSVTASWGAGIPYAYIHQFGGIINRVSSRGLAYKINIPARPYVMFQEEDKTRITETILNYLLQ
jgi:phage virion morphogenesis protein